MNCSDQYNSLVDFLDDLAVNPKFEYVVQAFAEHKLQGWIGVEETLGRETSAGQILHELAFERTDTRFGFSACNLKVTYLFNEDFVDEGSALLVFNLVGTEWVHLVWLKNQNQENFPKKINSSWDSVQAEEWVREYLGHQISVTHCVAPPENVKLYNFNPASEHLFTFKFSGQHFIGPSAYMAVDKESGQVRYLGFHGE